MLMGEEGEAVARVGEGLAREACRVFPPTISASLKTQDVFAGFRYVTVLMVTVTM